MALGKYSRVDNKNNRKSCWSVTVVVLVGLCLIGIWMMTSSSVVPLQDKNNNTPQFEDNPGDLPENVSLAEETKLDNNTEETKLDESKLDDNTEETKLVESKLDNNTEETKLVESKLDNNTEETKLDASKKVDEQSASDGGEKSAKSENSGGEGDSQEKEKSHSDENDKKSEESNDKSDSDKGEKMKDESSSENNGDQTDGQIEEKVDQNDNKELNKSSDEAKDDDQEKNQSSNETFPSGVQSELLNETMTQTGHSLLRCQNQRLKRRLRYHPRNTVGRCAIPLLGLIISHVLTIGKQSGVSLLPNIMNIVRGTVRKNHQPALSLFLKDINIQLSGQRAGRIFGTIMSPIPNWHKLRGIRIG